MFSIHGSKDILHPFFQHVLHPRIQDMFQECTIMLSIHTPRYSPPIFQSLPHPRFQDTAHPCSSMFSIHGSKVRQSTLMRLISVAGSKISPINISKKEFHPRSRAISIHVHECFLSMAPRYYPRMLQNAPCPRFQDSRQPCSRMCSINGSKIFSIHGSSMVSIHGAKIFATHVASMFSIHDSNIFFNHDPACSPSIVPRYSPPIFQSLPHPRFQDTLHPCSSMFSIRDSKISSVYAY